MKAAEQTAGAVYQREITEQIARIAADYQGKAGPQPLLDYPPYRSSRLRHPKSPFVCVDPDEVERWSPCFGRQEVDALDADLTAGHPGEPIGERIIVTGRLLDAAGKPNPVLSILIRRAAISAPALGATLHTAAALADDERPDGSWHAEWETLRVLARRTVVAGSQCSELLAGLQVHPQQMAKNLASSDVLGEQHVIAELTGKAPSGNYFGAADALIDESLDRAERIVKERP